MESFQATWQRLTQDTLAENFGWIQVGISAFFILLWLRSRHREENQSRFKLREADRNLHFKRGPEATKAAHEKPARPLRLDGIVADGAAHEVLGVRATATDAEIQKAYKERMKRYHPDRIGRPGTPEWQEATRIAEAINRARNEMLARLKRRS